MERGTRETAVEAAGTGSAGKAAGTEEETCEGAKGGGNFADQRRKDDADSGGDSGGEKVLRRERV
jgi:hypothetical protein